LVLDKVAPGTHTMKVTGQNGDASFSFEIADARMPAVTGLSTRATWSRCWWPASEAGTRGDQCGSWKLAVNGQPQSDAGPAGRISRVFSRA